MRVTSLFFEAASASDAFVVGHALLAQLADGLLPAMRELLGVRLRLSTNPELAREIDPSDAAEWADRTFAVADDEDGDGLDDGGPGGDDGEGAAFGSADGHDDASEVPHREGRERTRWGCAHKACPEWRSFLRRQTGARCAVVVADRGVGSSRRVVVVVVPRSRCRAKGFRWQVGRPSCVAEWSPVISMSLCGSFPFLVVGRSRGGGGGREAC